MFSVEFQTNVKNVVIEIPNEYKQELDNNSVRVIIIRKQKTSTTGMIARLMSNPLEVKDFTPLTREETHERK